MWHLLKGPESRITTERGKSTATNMIQTHNLSVVVRALYHCVATAAQVHLVLYYAEGTGVS